MNKRLLFLALALSLTCPGALRLNAADAPPQHKEPETELGKTMEQMNHAWRKLRKQAGDPASNASSLELVATISAAANKAVTLQPDKAKDLPEADRAKFIADYQTQMKALVEQVAKLEDAFKAGDNASASAIIRKIGGMQKEGHKEFKRPEH
jgi:soluble cytochrome b562